MVIPSNLTHQVNTEDLPEPRLKNVRDGSLKSIMEIRQEKYLSMLYVGLVHLDASCSN